MRRIRPAYRPTTQTEVLPQVAPQLPPAPVRILHWGEGTAVQEGPESKPKAQPLSPEQEEPIRSRIESLIAGGREAKIQSLVSQMLSAPLSAQTRAQIETWEKQFAQINPKEEETRALAIATLVLRVLRPAIVCSKDVEEQSTLVDWDVTCGEIVQLLLPIEGSVDRFLEECEIGLEEEKLFSERCKRADAATQIVLDTLSCAAERIGNSSPSPRFSRVGEREKRGEGLELTSQMVFGLVFLHSFAGL